MLLLKSASMMKLKLKNLLSIPGLAFLSLLPPMSLPILHVGYLVATKAGKGWLRSLASGELVKTINK